MGITLPSLSLAEWVGVWGGVLSTGMAMAQLISFLFRQPRLHLTYEKDKVERANRRYGYVNLLAQNSGWPSAKVFLLGTVKGSDFREQGLYWYDPKVKGKTKKTRYVILYGKNGNRKAANLFEFEENSNETTITSKQGYSAVLKINTPYDFDIKAYSEPSSLFGE